MRASAARVGVPGTQMRSPAHAIAYQPLQAGVVLACAPMHPARSPRRGPSPPCRAHRPGRECLRGRASGARERAPAAALPLALPPRRSGSARLRWRQTLRRSRSSESAHAHSMRCQSARQSCFLHARVLIHAQIMRAGRVSCIAYWATTRGSKTWSASFRWNSLVLGLLWSRHRGDNGLRT